MRLARAWLLCLALPHVVVAQDIGRQVDFLHIEANAGGSSGGHNAICFARTCYHFQQSNEGLLRIVRQDPESLDYGYRILENRPIHIARMSVEPAAEVRLRTALATYEHAQTRQIEVLHELRAQIELLATIAQRRRASAAQTIAGAGYFFIDQMGMDAAPQATTRSPAIEQVAERVVARLGRGAIDRRLDDLHAQIVALDLEITAPAAPIRAQVPASWIAAAGLYQELLAGFLALRVLRDALPVRVAALRRVAGADGELGPTEVQHLRDYAAQLETAMVELFSSQRPDWGYPMLVGLARLHALGASLESRQLVVLDVFPTRGERIPARTIRRHRRVLTRVAGELRDELAARRKVFFAAPAANEPLWAGVEVQANRWLELEGALARSTALRLPGGIPVPLKSATRSDWPLPQATAASVARATRTARELAGNYERALHRLYAYDLLQRNCATELLALIDSQLLGTRARRLQSALAFIPFVSFAQIRSAFPAASIAVRASHRHDEIERRGRETARMLTWLRESNTLTSQVYEANGDDPAFLFFTDDVPLLRPILGAANLVYATMTSTAGLVTVPFDSGERLRSGLNGMLFSLPELAFANIRKGTFPFAPQPRRREMDRP